MPRNRKRLLLNFVLFVLFVANVCCSQDSRKQIADQAEAGFNLIERARNAGLKGRMRMVFTPTGSLVFGAGGFSYVTESRVELDVEGYVSGSGPTTPPAEVRP